MRSHRRPEQPKRSLARFVLRLRMSRVEVPLMPRKTITRLVRTLGLPLLTCVGLAATLAGQTDRTNDVEVIAHSGQFAPDLGEPGVVLSNFTVPAISDGQWGVFSAFLEGPGVLPDGSNGKVLYRFGESSVAAVARQGDPVIVDGQTRTLAIIEAGIADRAGRVAFNGLLDDGRQGLFVWSGRPDEAPALVAYEGEAVWVDTDGGGLSGTLGNLGDFGSRTGAAFVDGDVAFSAGVRLQPSGVLSAVWLAERPLLQGGSYGLLNVANSAQSIGLGSGSFASFVPLAAAPAAGPFDAPSILVLAAVNASWASRAVFALDPDDGLHSRLDAFFTLPNYGVSDFRIANGRYSFLGGRTLLEEDFDLTKVGVWKGTTQLYLRGETLVDPADPGMGAIQDPVAQTIDEQGTVFFVATVEGGPYNNRHALFRHRGSAAEPYVIEGAPLLFPILSEVSSLESVQVSPVGDCVAHLVSPSATGGGETEQLVTWSSLVSPVGAPRRLLASDDIIELDGIPYAIEGFWSLGRNLFEPSLAGTGSDGHRSAMNRDGDLVLLVYFQPFTRGLSGNGPIAVVRVPVTPLRKLFADGFESGDLSNWTGPGGW